MAGDALRYYGSEVGITIRMQLSYNQRPPMKLRTIADSIVIRTLHKGSYQYAFSYTLFHAIFRKPEAYISNT